MDGSQQSQMQPGAGNEEEKKAEQQISSADSPKDMAMISHI